MEHLCRQCQHLDVAGLLQVDAVDSRPGLSKPIGSLADLIARSESCPLCQFFVRYLDKAVEGTWPSDSSNIDCAVAVENSWQSHLRFCGFDAAYRAGLQGQVSSQRIDFTGRLSNGLSVVFTRYTPKDGEKVATIGSRPILPMYQPVLPRLQQQYLARERQIGGIDFNLVRSWLQICKETHGNKCAQPPYGGLEPPSDLKLIDVQTRAVVQAPENAEYTALSYVWGGAQPVATANDLAALPWVLRLPDGVARTVHHAMQVTAQLGLRYLWVDALCIVQQPPVNPDKAHQLAQMDRIYSHATVTILASSSTSALAGIPGVEDRCLQEDTIALEDGVELVIGPPTLDEDIASSVWNTRGWTYQERMLANRVLVLGHEQAYWLCQTDAWCESTVAEPTVDSTDFIPSPEQSDSGPPQRSFSLSLAAYNSYAQDDQNLLEGYVRIVQEYTSRMLGYPSDGLNAIAGVLNSLAKTHSSFREIYQGLPQSCFDFALLWTPKSRCARPDAAQHSQPTPPSWTWAGWFGSDAHDGVEWDFGLYYSGRPWLQPGVDWFLVDAQGGSTPIARREQQLLSHAITVPPRPCGLREEHAVSRTPPEIPREPDLPGSHYLHFLTTSSTAFRVGARMPWKQSSTRSESTAPYQLCTASGVCCGTIVLPCSPPSEVHHPGTAQHNVPDLIFLSYTSTFEFAIEQSLNDGLEGEWPVANVMWIRRLADGTVERSCLARVLVEAWIEAELKAEWILLG